MALKPLKKTISGTGLNQEELATFLENIVTLVTAMQADAATVRTALNAVVTKLNADAGVTDTDYAPAGALTGTDTLKLTP